ncbi:MAG: CBS domain-containing protein [Deltaproteobacteria bacterium]|nr:CBS domain-containing protein [Deltaproteobacteria bacterium]
MGQQEDVSGDLNDEVYREFMRALLRDVRALDRLIDEGQIEEGIRRIGVEQEMFLVDSAWRPAPMSKEVLEAVDDSDVTTELAKFNLEINVPPLVLGRTSLRDLEASLNKRMRRVRDAAASLGCEVLLAGTLPTLTPSDLGLENMTESPRYRALNDALMRLRGRDYELRIQGTDDLLINSPTVMPEACNASFQVHFQVGADEFARLYNVAQAATGPVLAAATNSPMLFGKRLWRETRIAVFQQSVDTRSMNQQERSARVNFGRHWVKASALEVFQEDISRFRVLLGTPIDEDPFAVLDAGGVPQLQALRLHSGTVYRWNRCCYGISDGRPHLRIENRALPAGPTIIDEIANAAFWFGLMAGAVEEYEDITQLMEFDDAQTNFLNAARYGLGAQLTWVGGKALPARTLLKQQLFPLAREGLQSVGIDEADIDRYLGVVEARVDSGRTGSQWVLQSVKGMQELGTRFERLCAVTAGAVKRQNVGAPIVEWSLAKLEEAGGWRQHFMRVEQFMTTDVFTVNEGDLVDLVAAILQWRKLRYIMVEDDNHHLVGVVSARTLFQLLGDDLKAYRGEPRAVHEVMNRGYIAVAPETPTLEAIALMRDHEVGCLPVIEAAQVVGLITERHFVHLAEHLMERVFRHPLEGTNNND